MRNAEIAAALRELGTLYELDGADRFRVGAYKDAAKVAADSPVSLEQLSAEGRLTELPGFGKTLAVKVEALIETGSIPAADKLKETIPASLVEVTRVPGLGAKKIRRLYDELGVTDLESLRAAAEQQQIREMKGFGVKVEERVLAELETLPDQGDESERRLLSKVMPVAEELAAELERLPEAGRVAVAGSVRRWGETCKDIDIIATSDEPAALGKALADHELVAQASAAGEKGTSVMTHAGIKVDLRITPEETFGNLLQHFTGSMEHNVQLRERALKRGLSVSEHGVTETDPGTKGKAKKRAKVNKFADEAGVYKLLGLPYIEPELRQGRGEIEAADSGELPELVTLADIRGDLHSHTTLSDGRNTLHQMAEAARARGYAYFAITDHSASHGFGDHVDARALAKRIKEVAKWNESAPKGFRLLAGSEVNIGTKGELDYPDELLAELDWVVASVHTSFNISEKAMTERVVEAIGHPLVDCIGHLSGRLLLRREPYAIDVEQVAEAAAANGTMIEINGNPNRRDLNEHHAKLAAEAGVMICCNTDAHGVDTLENMKYSVATARRAWLSPEQIANTRPWRSFAPLRKRAKNKKAKKP